jgi:uncharacterized membrane protein YedE/YeeE
MSRTIVAAAASGALFGVGLALSAMTDRQVVLGFLDFAGAWNPTLAFVMGGALAVTLPAFRAVLKRPAPALGGFFRVPAGEAIDAKLLAGAAIFGVGWGLAGFCPGPVLVGAAAGLADAWVFVPAMIAGSWIAGRIAVR